MIKLRKYNKEQDGEIYPSFDNLYIEFDNNYIPVEVIATGLKGEAGDIVVKFKNNEEDVIRRRNINEHSFFIEDDTIPLKNGGFYTCGYKTKDGKWYKWVLCLKEMVPYDNLHYKLLYGLDGNNRVVGEVKIDGYSNAQEWIRKAECSEIELLKVKALESPEKCIVDMAKEIFENSEYEFKPFDKVLVRDADDETWAAGIYSYYVDRKGCRKKHGVCGNDYGYEQCIPYEGNEDLWMTINKPKEK